MKHIKNFKMFEAVNDEGDFIIDAETTQQEFDSALEDKLDARHDYGNSETFSDIVSTIVNNSLIAIGKTDDEAYDICSELEGFFDYNQKNIENEYADYGHNVEGTNTYKGRVVCEYEAGGDGYGFSATIKDITELFEDILELLGFTDVNEATLFDLKKELKQLSKEKEMLTKKVKSLPSPSAYATKAKADLLVVDKKTKETEKEIKKILVNKK